MLQVQAAPATIPHQDVLELTELTAITPLDGSAVTKVLGVLDSFELCLCLILS